MKAKRGNNKMKKLNHTYSPFILMLFIGMTGCGTDSAQDTTNEAVKSSGVMVEERVAGEKNRLNNTTDWATYRGDQDGSAYSVLDQITVDNVAALEEVWTYDTRDLVGPGMQSNPIIVDGIMYFADPELNLVALDATTGEELWLFDPSLHDPRGEDFPPGVQRAEVYWEDENGENARIFHMAKDTVWAVDPKDGTLIESFGKGGALDMAENHT